MFLTILLRPILLGLIFQGLIKPRVGHMYQRHFPIIFHQIIRTRQSRRKFLPRALCLITEQSDVKTHRDYSLTLGFTLLYLPPMLELDLCHIKTISNPYMGHIWVNDHPRCPSWTLDFSPRLDFPLSPRSLFHTRQRFLLPNHVTSGWMRPRAPFFPVSGFEPTIPLATNGQRLHFRLATTRTNQKPGNLPSGPPLLLVGHAAQRHVAPGAVRIKLGKVRNIKTKQ